jgi:hypothetical protein
MHQIERSFHAFHDMSPVLPCGTLQIIQCEGEADSEVAKASANDVTGMTYTLGSDSDYLVYGCSNVRGRMGETKYLQFRQLDPFDESLCVGKVLTRSDVATSMGLPSSSAMVSLSILVGNDYTSPFVKHDDHSQRKEYWESIQWCEVGEEDSGDGERLPPEGKLSSFDIQGIADYIADKVEHGLKLTSDIEDLKMAIEFSYELYIRSGMSAAFHPFYVNVTKIFHLRTMM